MPVSTSLPLLLSPAGAVVVRLSLYVLVIRCLVLGFPFCISFFLATFFSLALCAFGCGAVAVIAVVSFSLFSFSRWSPPLSLSLSLPLSVCLCACVRVCVTLSLSCCSCSELAVVVGGVLVIYLVAFHTVASLFIFGCCVTFAGLTLSLPPPFV